MQRGIKVDHTTTLQATLISGPSQRRGYPVEGRTKLISLQ